MDPASRNRTPSGGSQHEVTAPAFVRWIFFWPHDSCRVAQLQLGMEKGPTVSYRQLGCVLGGGCSPRELRSHGLSFPWRPQEDKQVGTNLSRTCWGEMNIAPSQRLELKGVPQLYSTHQSTWKWFLFKLLTARTVLLRLWLEASQADVHEEILIMQCFSLA